jgi:hypothetical protein
MSERAGEPTAVGDFDPAWLAAREPADHEARAGALAEALRAAIRPAGSDGSTDSGALTVRDLGSGTGSLARWLAPLLDGPQHWVLYDRDPRLLELAADATAGLTDATGRPVQVRTATADLTALSAADLAGSAAVTASALLDLLTAAEVDALARACAAAGCPVLWTLSVTGEVVLDPADPLDGPLAAAFDAHQRRPCPRGRLLGPDAPDAATAALRRHGMAVHSAESPWRLDSDRAELLAGWLRGRVEAAVEQEPRLAGEAARWLAERLSQVSVGRLHALVGHRDLLALPASPPTLPSTAPTTPARTEPDHPEVAR